MKNVKWQMKEDFAFPSEVGKPLSAENLKVTPRFTLEKVEGRPKLTGIYHLAVNLNLSTEKGADRKTGDAILIDDVDINGKTGYFEYAVPFNIDFPPEADDPIEIQTLNTTHEIDKHGNLSVVWDVECSYKEAGIQQKRTEEQHSAEAAVENKETKKEAVVQEEQPKESVAQHDAASEDKDEIATADASEEVKKVPDVAVETASFSEGDEVLTFLAELEDGISTTGFRLNDVLVQGES